MKRDEVTLDNVIIGLQRFEGENGHYPAANEIDSCPYLPSSRQIQRKLGGLRKVREILGLNDLDYWKGKRRRLVIKKFLGLSITAEKMTKLFLDKRYGEICVHEEKKYGDGRNRVDFFIYAKDNFAVEVFNTNSLRNMIGNLNIKLHKYRDFPFKLYFVVFGDDFSQNSIDIIIFNKKILPLPANMKCLTFEEFKWESLNNLPPLQIRMKYTKAYPHKTALLP